LPRNLSIILALISSIIIHHAKNSMPTHVLGGIGIIAKIREHTVIQAINSVFILVFNDNIFREMNVITCKCIFGPITNPKKII
jgi:hypothetical protein